MEEIFDGKVAIVTGGNFGIGRATAIAFAKRGAHVVVVDNVEDKENTTLKLISNAGEYAFFIQCDVSNSEEVKSMIEKTLAKYGRVDFAINNSGIVGQMANTHECTEENFDRIMAVNLKGIWLCMKYEIPEMLKYQRGVIVNCASVAGLNGFAGFPANTASMHGVVGLTKSAALEYAKQGIRINAVCPGVIHTDMIDPFTGKDPEVEKQYTAMEPIGRVGDPEEVAEAIAWLCSDAASFVTGVAMPIDGGIMAG